MSATRQEIDQWRAEDGLEPYVDQTLARLFADWKPIFSDDTVQSAKSRPVNQQEEE